MKRVASLFGALLPFLAACATAEPSPARERYIRAHAHGWLELSVRDASIPNMPVGTGSDLYQRPSCSLEVRLNSEPFLEEPLFPHGARPPYSVETGFRFPAPAGDFEAEITYSGCRVSEAGAGPVHVVAAVTISPGFVSRFILEGEVLTMLPDAPDDAVTLESLADDLEDLRSDRY